MKIPRPATIVNYLTYQLNLYDFRARIATAILNKKAAKYNDIEYYIDLSSNIFNKRPSNYIGWSIKPMQKREEIKKMLSILGDQKVRLMLEIGTANGGTLFLFTRMLEPNAKIISLDLPGGQFGGGYEKFKIHFFSKFAIKNQRIFLIRGNSHSKKSMSAVKSIVKEQQLDFLFIDGDHSYLGAKTDFLMYSPLVRKGGLIAFHDICKGPYDSVGEVNKFWNEVKKGYKNEEIIQNNSQEGFGIGVLYV